MRWSAKRRILRRKSGLSYVKEPKRIKKNTKALLREEPEEARHFKEDLDELKADLKSINDDIATNEKLKTELSDTKLTYEEYLELFGKVTNLLKKTYYIDDKDALIRKFFLNFTVQGEMQPSGK